MRPEPWTAYRGKTLLAIGPQANIAISYYGADTKGFRSFFKILGQSQMKFSQLMLRLRVVGEFLATGFSTKFSLHLYSWDFQRFIIWNVLQYWLHWGSGDQNGKDSGFVFSVIINQWCQIFTRERQETRWACYGGISSLEQISQFNGTLVWMSQSEVICKSSIRAIPSWMHGMF